MQPNNNNASDNTGEILYNTSNVNDQWTREVGDKTITGEVVEKLDKSQFRPITVKGCEHTRTAKDDEESDGYYAIKCVDCPVGWLVRKESK